MLCTDCSKEVKPVVAIDIDGTLGDFHSHFLRFATDYLGYGNNPDRPIFADGYDGREGFKRWFLRVWLDNEDGGEHDWNQIKLAYRQGGMKRSMPVYDGASSLCQAVRFYGAELWLTTTRPYLRLDNVDPDTRFWLENNGIEYDGLLYDDDKYEVLASYVDKERVVAVLDDLPEQWEAAARAFGWKVPILRRTRWNAGVVSEAKVDDLGLAWLEILDRITKWKEAH